VGDHGAAVALIVHALSTKTMRLITRKSRFWKYLLPAVAAVMVVAAAVVPRPAPPAPYRRYVSQALPDKVRYTFLYPVTWDAIDSFLLPAHRKGKYLQSVQIYQKDIQWPYSWFKEREDEGIIVLVANTTVKPLKSSRSEKQSTDRYAVSHTVLIDDPRAHEHFEFKHIEDHGATAFTQHDHVVVSSFRVLLPGEPVPTP